MVEASKSQIAKRLCQALFPISCLCFPPIVHYQLNCPQILILIIQKSLFLRKDRTRCIFFSFLASLFNLLSVQQLEFKTQRLNQMSRPANYEQTESGQKDLLISSLKKQLYELKDRQHEFIPLENEVTTIESRYDMLQQQKERIQDQHKIKIEINSKSIAQLRSQVDNLKLQIHKSSVSIEEVLRDINNLKRTCENRDNQIAALIGSSQQLNLKNQQLTEDNRGQSSKIKSFKQERNKLDLESQKLIKSVEQSVNLLKNLEKEARSLEASNSRLDSILGVAEKDYSQLLEQMKNRQEVVLTTHKKLDSLNLEIETLREKTKKLEKECLKSQEQYKSASESLDIFIGKNKDQAKRIKLFENELRNIQNELDKSILQRDALQNDHEMLAAQNQDLNEEITTIFQQITEYERLNNQLQDQIHNYIAIDEEARRLLDRKDNMLKLVQSVSRRILTTADNIAHLRG